MTEPRLYPVRKPRKRRFTDQQVWDLMQTGRTRAEIAKALKIAVPTADHALARLRKARKNNPPTA